MSTTRDDVQDATGKRTFISGRGFMRAFPMDANSGDYTAVTGVPTNGKVGYAPGCLWQNYLGTAGTILYVNTGTAASSTWLAIA